MIEPHSPLLLPIGTQVVSSAAVYDDAGALALPPGAVGVVIAIADSAPPSYRVRFADGHEAKLQREQLRIRKHYQRDSMQPDARLAKSELAQYIICRCVIGSRAYGLDDDASDTDRRGFYLPPADLHWSLAGLPEQLEDATTRDTYWELQKFLVLALKANPNVLECLSTPLVEYSTPLADELRALRGAFLSKLIYQTYNDYVLSQFKKMEQDLRTKGAVKQKHAMHLLRLLLAGTDALREGEITVHVGAQRERLLAIKRGAVPWDEINAWRLELHRAFDAAFAATRLPDRPDYARVNTFLLRARRSML